LNSAFIDVFTKIKREREDTHDDNAIIPIENIVAAGLFDKIIESFDGLKKICCLYSLAFETIYNVINQRSDFSNNILIEEGSFNCMKFDYKDVEIIKLNPPRFDFKSVEPKINQYCFYLFDADGNA